MDTTEDLPRFGYISCAALTDVGRKRKNNEDNYGTFPDAGVFCVADGMGGARDGEVASRIVVEHLTGALRNWDKISPPIPIEDRLALVDKCLDAASLWINKYAASHDATGCGTTFVGVVFDPGKPGHAMAVHAGDSRLYRIHRHKITQITCDHSVANMTGVKDENELNPVFRNMILRAVGIKPTVELERTSFEVVSGDWVLICSDGLTKMVDDKAILKTITTAEGGRAAAHALVAEANRAGGRDNITVVLLHVGELPVELPVHDRLTESEFLTCLGANASDAATTTETVFTMPTGAGTTEPSAVDAVPAGNAPPARTDGWLSDDDDQENATVPVPVSAGEEGSGDAAGKKEEETSGVAGIVPAEPGDGPDADTKTTEDIPPPFASGKDGTSQSKTSEEAGTTEDMVPVVVSHRLRTLLPLFLAAAVLAGVAGVGIRKWQNAREVARIEAAEAARKAEEERLDAIKDAEDSFILSANSIRSLLTNLLARVSESGNPESLSTELKADMDSFVYYSTEALDKGVTNAVNSKKETMDKLAGQIRTAITERRRKIDEGEAERKRLEALAKAKEEFEKEADAALKALRELTGPTDIIKGSDNPESFTNKIAEAKVKLDAAWKPAGEAGVDDNVREAKFKDFSSCSNDVAALVSKRNNVLKGEYGQHEGKCAEREKATSEIRNAASYHEALAAIAAASAALPSYGDSSPWKAKYDSLREKYKNLNASISANTAKIEVRNAGNVDLAVTLGEKTETIEKGKSRTFDKLDVWTEYKLFARVTLPGSAGFQPAAIDYTLDPASSTVATKGPNATVEVSFKATYKGDPKVVVRNDNAVAIKANDIEIGPTKSHSFTGTPRTEITIAYECDNTDYEFASKANKSVEVAFGDAGAKQEIAAPTLVAKPKPATIADLKPSPTDLPVSTDPRAKQTPSAGGDARTKLEETKKEFEKRIDKYKDTLENIKNWPASQDLPLFYFTACFKPYPNKGQYVTMMDDLRLLASTIRIASSSADIDDIKDKYDLFMIVVRRFASDSSLEDKINGYKYCDGEEQKKCTEKDAEDFRQWKQGVQEW